MLFFRRKKANELAFNILNCGVSYNKGVEVDFYIPNDSIAIQVCYNLDNIDDTFDREVNALLKFLSVLECRKLMIITRDSEQRLEIDNKTIEVIPVWKWLLNL